MSRVILSLFLMFSMMFGMSAAQAAGKVTVLVLGQSNAANFLQTPYASMVGTSFDHTTKLWSPDRTNSSIMYVGYNDIDIRNTNPNSVANYFSCSTSEQNCNGGSMWARTGRKLKDQYGYTDVNFILAAIPSTKIDQWFMDSAVSVPTRNNGMQTFNLYKHFGDMLTRAKAMGVTDVVWVQGESDAPTDDTSVGTSAAYYSWALRTLATKVKQVTGKKLTVIHSTICHQKPSVFNNPNNDPKVQAIVNGRIDAAQTRPDLITLYESNDGLYGSAYRRDAGSNTYGCHLNDAGADYAAGSMAYAIHNF